MAEAIAWLETLPGNAEVEITARPALDRPMTDAERAREYRRRKGKSVTDRHAPSREFVTEGVGGGLSNRSDKRAEKQGKETDLGTNLEGNTGGDRHETSRQNVTRRRRAKAPETPIPEGWTPSDVHRAYAAKHGLDLEVELDAFRGWAEGRTTVSWNGTFSTRLANAVKWRRERPSGINGPRTTKPVQPSHGMTGFEKATFVR